MLINKPAIICILLSACIIMVGCEKNKLHTSDFVPIGESDSRVKIIFMSTYQKNPRYQINLNGVRVSPLLSSTGTSPLPTPFPGGGFNTTGSNAADYLAVPAQQNTISIAIPKFNTNVDSVQLATSNFTYQVGKKHSLYFTDTAANTATFLVEDSLQRPDSGFTRYKFIHLMPDLPAVDLYIGTLKVASNVPYKGVSASFVVPTNHPSVVWAIRTVGGATNLFTQSITGSIPNQKVLTVLSKGYNSITAPADVRRRSIHLITNQ